ncbi:MAG: insulinase family protein, partial [Brevundimonas sp.]
IVVLAGDIDAASARPLMERYFGSIPRGPVNEPAQAPVPVLAAPIERTMHDRVPYVSLQRYWPGPGLLDDDAVTLEVAASVLGGLASSRLDKELVRGDATAVSVTSSYSAFHRTGWFDVTVNVKPGEDAAAVRARTDQIIADFIANGPTADELQRVVTQVLSQRINGLEQLNGRAATLAEGALYANDPTHYRKELERLAALTPAQVQAVAARYLSQPSFNLTVEPGEREPYQNAGATPAGARPAAPASDYQATPRDPMPAIGQVGALDFPTVSRARLSNGIEVIATQSSRIPATRVAVEFDAGWSADAADALGVEALMLRAMTEGAGGKDANEMAEARERLGAFIGVGATMDRTTISLTALTANLAPSLDLLADVTRRPDFEPAVVERLRAQQLSSIREELATPAGMGNRALYETLYSGAYGRGPSGLGDPAVVEAATPARLEAFHDAWIRPDGARIYVVSDRPLSEITPLLESRFGDWAAPATPRVAKAPVAAPPVQPRIILIDRPQSPQSLILGGEVLDLAGADDRLVLGSGVEILGSAFWSRINSDLRETRGWSYGSRSSVTNLEDRSPYIINAPVQADRTGEAIASLIAVHGAFFGDNGVTADELTRVRDSSTRRLAGQFETSGAVLSTLQ